MKRDHPLVAGVELGGTKTVVVLAQGRHILAQQVIATTSPEETLGAAHAQLSVWAESPGFAALGIAAFGPLQLNAAMPEYGKLHVTPKPGWAGIDVAGRLTRGFSCPWSIETDVNAAALAECCWGAAQGLDDLCYVTVGTGVGGGLIVNGRPVHGLIHPELGHMRLRRDPADPFAGVCPFHGDCIEGLVSGPALRARFGKDLSEAPDDDPVWRTVAGDLSELVSAVLLTTSARRVLLGGTVMLKRSFLLPGIRRGVLQRLGGYLPALDDAAAESIVGLPGLGPSAGPLGAIAVGLAGLSA